MDTEFYSTADLVLADLRDVPLGLVCPKRPTSCVDELLQDQIQDIETPDQPLIREVLSLLQTVNVSTLVPREASDGPSGAANTPLQVAILKANSKAFHPNPKGSLAPPPPAAPRTATPRTTKSSEATPASLTPNGKKTPRTHQPTPPKLHWKTATALAAENPAAAIDLSEQNKQLGDKLQNAISKLLDMQSSLVAKLSKQGDAPDHHGGDVAAMDTGDDTNMPTTSSIYHRLSASDTARLLSALKEMMSPVVQACEAKTALSYVSTESFLSLMTFLAALAKAGKLENVDWGNKKDSKRQLCEIALLSSLIALRLMTSPSSPPQARGEETVQSAIDVTRHHLHTNILGGGSSATTAESSSKSITAIAAQASDIVEYITEVLDLLCTLLPMVKLQPQSILPLLRTCIMSLGTAESLTSLQAKVTVFLSVSFSCQADVRRTLFDDLFQHAIPLLPVKKNPPKHFIASEVGGKFVRIQAITGAVLHMVQGSIRLPALDTAAGLLTSCSNHAAWAADYFWTRSFEKLIGSRSEASSDSASEFRTILDNIVHDLLSVVDAPEWPAASFLLLRLASLLNSEHALQNSDPVVRNVGIDFLGSILMALQTVETKLAEDREWLENTIDFQGSKSTEDVVHTLLFAYLANKSRQQPAYASAQQFWLVRLFTEEVTELSRTAPPDSALHEVLETYYKKQEELERINVHPSIESNHAWKIMRIALHPTLERAGQAMLQWLLELLNVKLQGPAVRAKALKALGDVVGVNTSLLELDAVHAAVETTLQDEAVSVREASLNLIGRHIADNANLAAQFYDVLIKASEDSGPSVRRAAIKLLYECCIKVPGFPYATDACRAIIMRAADTEESVQNAVAKLFHSLWFTEASSKESSLPERAKQLASVASAVYEAGGRGVHVPLDPAHPLIAVVQNSMCWSSKGGLEKELHAGRALASALLDQLLIAEGNTTTNNDESSSSLPFLLALHALCRADVDLCVPEEDPAKFVRCLTPYLKDGSEGGGAAIYESEEQQRNAAERLLCVLSLIDDIATAIPSMSNVELGDGLAEDLIALINHHRYTQVMAEACKCLCTLAKRQYAAQSRLGSLAAVYWNWLQSPQEHHPGHIPRFLFILGQLCRHGLTILEQFNFQAAKQPFTTDTCLAVLLKYHQYKAGGQMTPKIQKSALEAIGLLAVSKPAILVNARSPAAAAFAAALKPTAPAPLKLAALNSLLDILEADAEDLRARQRQVFQTKRQAGASAGGKNSKKRGGRGGKQNLDDSDGGSGSGATAAIGVVPVQNGGDDTSLSGAVIQAYWEAVVKLADDASMDGTAGGGNVRRGVIAVMEVVARDGLVGPWTAIPALVVLATDPVEDTRIRALKLLRMLGEKHVRYLDADRVMKGLTQVHAFHQSLAKASPMYRFSSPLAPAAGIGLQALYTDIVWSNRQLRVEFLKTLMRSFKAELGSAKKKSTKQTTINVDLLAFYASVIAVLPLKRGDEACILLQEASMLLQSHGDAILHDLQAQIEESNTSSEAESTASMSPTLVTSCQKSLVMSILAVLSKYLRSAYAINFERISAYHSGSGEKRKQEERVPLVKDDGVVFPIRQIDFMADGDLERCKKHCMAYDTLIHTLDVGLLSNQATTGGKKKAAAADKDIASGGKATTARKPAAARGRKRGRAKAAEISDSSDEEPEYMDDDDGDDDEVEVVPKTTSRKRRTL